MPDALPAAATSVAARCRADQGDGGFAGGFHVARVAMQQDGRE
jgi:hypothetical protein